MFELAGPAVEVGIDDDSRERFGSALQDAAERRRPVSLQDRLPGQGRQAGSLRSPCQ